VTSIFPYFSLPLSGQYFSHFGWKQIFGINREKNHNFTVVGYYILLFNPEIFLKPQSRLKGELEYGEIFAYLYIKRYGTKALPGSLKKK
jgi:hypothetical protein